VTQRNAGGFENGFEIFENALGLLAYIRTDKLAGFRVQSDLAGHKQEAVGAYGLGVWADGFRAAVG
jgi:hypothetical protein